MRLALPSSILAAILVSCSDAKPPEPTPPPRDRPLARDGSFAREVTSTPDRVRVQADLATLRAGIQAYHAEKGAWPASLADVPMDGKPNYPADLVYDPATGRVGSQAYPSF